MYMEPHSVNCGAEHEGDGSQESDGRSSIQSLEFMLRAMVEEPLGFLLVSFVFNVVLEITWRVSLILDKPPTVNILLALFEGFLQRHAQISISCLLAEEL